IIVDPKFLWLGRTGVTAYFQFLGKRRHGRHIANRFCLNHYLAGVKTIGELKNLYTASEYAKLRPLVYPQAIAEFQQKNRDWIAAFLPNFKTAHQDYSHHPVSLRETPLLGQEGRLRGFADESLVQKFFERMLSGGFGQWLE